jgi:2-polyprenyl-3-methyl-5-hydroxy-6-metoxy-1,4-benzoquinol methylase
VDNLILNKIGFSEYDSKDFYQEQIVLRDGRPVNFWIHEPSGHGILDNNIWVDENFYEEQYRQEFSSNGNGKKQQCEEHLRLYDSLNARQFELFKQFLTKDSKCLEIGGSFGGIASKVCDFGVKKYHVVEPNKEDALFVESNCPSAKVFNSTFDKAQLEKNYYDIIVAFDVVEHVPSPGNFLKKCHSLLKPGGRLVIAVPNHNDVLLTNYECNEYKNFYYHKAHINYFTSKSICDLCELAGFDGRAKSFLDYSFFNHVYWHQNNKPMATAEKAFVGEIISNNDALSNKINNFYKRVELEYENLINENMAGGALIFSGVKNG